MLLAVSVIKFEIIVMLVIYKAERSE